MTTFPETPASILFINVTRIGDTLFATPAIRAVAAAWPLAKVTVLGHPKRVTVLENLSFIHDIGSITKNRAICLGWLTTKKFDLAFVYGSDENLISYALRVAKRVVAFQQRNKSINKKLFASVHPALHGEHEVKKFLRLPEAIGVSHTSLRIGFQVTPAEIAAANRRLKDANIATASPLIGLQVASFQTKAYRDWPITYFAELCERILVQWPTAHFLIFGGSEEKQRTAWLKEQLGNHAVVFAGHLSLRETGALMSLIDLYIGIDTGPTHIMSSFDIPMVLLYHCLNSSHIGSPLNHPHCIMIDHPELIRGNCTNETSMSAISVEDVFCAVQNTLNIANKIQA